MSDVRLVVKAEGSTARRMLGMGSIGALAGPLEWQWEKRYAARGVQFYPNGGQFDFVRSPARTPHGAHGQTGW